MRYRCSRRGPGCDAPGLFLNTFKMAGDAIVWAHVLCESHAIHDAAFSVYTTATGYNTYKNDMFFTLTQPGADPAFDDCVFLWLDALHTYAGRVEALQEEMASENRVA